LELITTMLPELSEIKSIRKSLNISQKELGEILNIPNQPFQESKMAQWTLHTQKLKKSIPIYKKS